jgi:AraC-like DNA-binding protein/mannose-6-phosphate isomerase-like protein (cupin superfamily)
MPALIPFYKNLSLSEQKQSINWHIVQSVGKYDSSTPHRHGYYELMLIENGQGSHFFDFESFDVTDFSIHVVLPGQVHQLNLAEGTKGCVLTFSDYSLHNYLHSSIIQNLRFLHQLNKLNVIKGDKTWFDPLLKLAYQINETDDESIRFSILNLILNTVNLKCTESKPNSSVIYQFHRLLEQHFQTEHLPSYYAGLLNLTEKALNEKVKKDMGITSTQFIAQRICLEAKRLLKNTSLSIKEIGFDLGFQDPAYFNRFIKKQLGFSPNELRNAE